MNYRIKPLVWEASTHTKIWTAKTQLQTYVVAYVDNGKWQSSCEENVGWWELHDSPLAARAACDEDYRKLLLTMLEEVEP